MIPAVPPLRPVQTTSTSVRPARRPRWLRRVVGTTVCTLLVTLGAAAPSSAVAPPTPTGLPAGIESLASYVGANSCDATAKPGATALGTLLARTYPGTSFSVPRACPSSTSSVSEHYDGRAIDWMTDVRSTTQRAQATEMLAWLLATDGTGNTYANARRLGVMYLIWNNRIWSAYRPSEGWVDYQGCTSAAKAGSSYDTSCHRNHVHLSLSWAGGMARTSWWSKRVAPPEYGPCRVADLSWAPPNTAANLTRCPSLPAVRTRSGISSLGRSLVAASGTSLRQGSSGAAVGVLQSGLGLRSDGVFSASTRASLVSWQNRAGVPATGVSDVTTWRAMTRPFLAGIAPVGLTGDGSADLISVAADGALRLHQGPRDDRGTVIGSGWSSFDTVLSAGDFTGDQRVDLLGRRSDGTLWLYAGRGTGGFLSGVQIGRGWQGFTALFAPGDFTGDGRSDLMGRLADGTLWLYAGDGRGGFAGPGRQIGSGWGSFDTIFSPGDFSGDLRPDVMARRSDGTLWMWAGTGTGALRSGTQVGQGWTSLARVLSAGDVTGDWLADVVAVDSGGAMLVYTGSGLGAFRGSAIRASDGWTDKRLVVGVR